MIQIRFNRYVVGNRYQQEIVEVNHWLRENIGKLGEEWYWYDNFGGIGLLKEEDAVAFKLRFGLK